MFTGIVEELAKVKSVKDSKDFYTVEILSTFSSKIKVGDSIAINGVCLTATSIKKFESNSYIFSVNISEETNKRSISQFWNKKSIINLEKSLKVGDEISGHFVYGHIDCFTKILKIQKLDSSWNYEFKNNQNMKKFIVEKGSISINGISLTIANISSKSFYISIIPHTYHNTNLKNSKVNDFVNIEFDVLGKYVIKHD